MVTAADEAYTDEEVTVIERSACPTCGSCSGMFTANSMNCLTEALGLSLPGNGSVLATHADRERLFREAGHLVVDITRRHYEQDDTSRSEEQTSELQSLMRISYAVFYLKNKPNIPVLHNITHHLQTLLKT